MQPEIQYGAQSGQLTLAQNKVLRNTYMLLALTMVPTVIGALVGMATGGIIMQHPIMMSLVMIAGVIGLQFSTPRPLSRLAAMANCKPMTPAIITSDIMIGCCMMIPPVAMPTKAPMTVGTMVSASSM